MLHTLISEGLLRIAQLQKLMGQIHVGQQIHFKHTHGLTCG